MGKTGSNSQDGDRVFDRRSVLLGSTTIATAAAAIGAGTPTTVAQAQPQEQSRVARLTSFTSLSTISDMANLVVTAAASYAALIRVASTPSPPKA
jgi:hypothetical protein